MKPRQYRQETKAVRGGRDHQRANQALGTPIFQTSTFEAADNEEQLRLTPSDKFYTRYGNPTNTAAEKAIAELEGTDAAQVFSSGMCAITTTIMALLKGGDHIVSQRDIYGGANKFLDQWLPKMGITTTFVDTNDFEAHACAIRPNTRLLYLETPTNPTLRVVDLRKAAALAKEHKLISMVDSTFATPINTRPAELGIDLIMHSGTKYFAGHSDLICGVITGRDELIAKIHETRTVLGGNMDPHAAWLLLRGIKTLAVRVERQNRSALAIAQFLAQHKKVKKVHYPFLEGHAERTIAMAQMNGGGGMLSFEVDGSHEDARRVSESLKLFTLAPSLGGVDSLVTLPVVTSHAMIAPEHRLKMGVTEQLLRLSVGIENVDDLIDDLEQALTVIVPSRETVQAD
ncbi:MAG TPA: aminotransferase class I/II-fold pyridoxal phosphate-dependent enzyme [Terriglobales bacterium]